MNTSDAAAVEPPATTPRRRLWPRVGLAVALALAGAYAWAWITYPTDRTPEGAYLRVVSAVNRGEPAELFAYLETQAQHACFTIGDYRRKAKRIVGKAYPAKRQKATLSALEPIASRPEGPEVFALYAQSNAWLDRLRRDLSRVERVEVDANRATVETARGTRYSFRQGDNGLWGLTLFTAHLTAEAERAARDFSMIEQNARDYEQARLRR